MASLDCGAYGFTVINPNGETNQRVFCALDTTNTGAITTGSGGSVDFTAIGSDEYRMAMTNPNGSWTAIRTPVSGLFRIRASVSVDLTSAATTASLFAICDKGCNYGASLFTQGVSGASYNIAISTCAAASGQSPTLAIDTTVFLERDCYISLNISSSGGTTTPSSTAGKATFSVELISAENSNKVARQL